MRATGSVNVQPVRSYFAELAAYTRRTLPDVIRLEGAAIVRSAMKMQKHFKIAEVKERAHRKGIASFRISPGSFGGTTNVSKRKGKPGRQWMVAIRGRSKPAPMGLIDISSQRFSALQDGGKSPGTKGKKLSRSPNGVNKIRIKIRSQNGWRVKNEDWQKFKQLWKDDMADTKKRIQDRLSARGLTAKSWMEIIEKIHGADTSGVPDFVRRARPISNKSRTVAAVLETGANTSSFSLTVVNGSGVAAAAGGARKLQSAISRRREYFMRNVKEGFVFGAKNLKAKYPWANIN